ncbi:hypothetical protein [Rhodovulum sp. FJ3]|nr:hypothetical protein [Rhodovulum sp. FJ3]MDV4166882.1 hypothetical protein [Rhodovulum sp. FJ3]
MTVVEALAAQSAKPTYALNGLRTWFNQEFRYDPLWIEAGRA